MKIGIIGGWNDQSALLKAFPVGSLVIAPKGLIDPCGLTANLRTWCECVDGVVINTKYVPKSVIEHMPQDTPLVACFGGEGSVIAQVRRLMDRLEREFDRDEVVEAAARVEGEANPLTDTVAADAATEEAEEVDSTPSRDPVVHRVVREGTSAVVPEAPSSVTAVAAEPPSKVGDPVKAVSTEEEPSDILVLPSKGNGSIDWSLMRHARLGQVFKVMQPLGSNPKKFAQLVQASRSMHKIKHGVETKCEMFKGFALLKIDGVSYSQRRAQPGISASLVQQLASEPSSPAAVCVPQERAESPPEAAAAQGAATAAATPPASQVRVEGVDETFWRDVFVQRLTPGLSLESAAKEADQALEMLRQRFRRDATA